MHNRARLITAAFLTKHLGLDWRPGVQWFFRWLLDGDVPNNSGNWQWTAGTGNDPAPYFRIFNPTSQGRKFDPDGAYIRRDDQQWFDVVRWYTTALIEARPRTGAKLGRRGRELVGNVGSSLVGRAGPGRHGGGRGGGRPRPGLRAAPGRRRRRR